VTDSQRREIHWDRAVGWHEAACAAAGEGRLDEALSLARRALRGLAGSVGERHPDHANARLTLGRILQRRGQTRQALPHIVQAVTVLRRSRSREPVVVELTVDALLAAASCQQALGAYAAGRPFARAALALALRRLGGSHVLSAAAHNQLGVLGKFLGRFAEAERHYAIALPIYQRAFGDSSREVAALLHNIGGLEHARRRFDRGEPPAREAVVIARRLWPASDPERLAHEVAHAGLLDGLGRQGESILVYRRALAVFTRCFGREHHEVACTLQNLAAAEHVIGRVRAAERHYVEACALLLRLRGPGDPDLALARHNLAILYRDTGQAERARPLLVAALRASRRRLGARHPTTRSCVEAMASLGSA
jgi:hypothetical protein